MILANYIKDLLYRYDCVIIPNFGGFITNKISAKFNVDSSCFYPPSKQIAFNSHLKGNDGLLANYISSIENISFEEASKFISTTVNDWNTKLETNTLQLEAIGTLSLNDKNQLIFEPELGINYLSESFGLAKVDATAVERYKQEVKPLIPADKEITKKGIPAFIKYAATAAILLTLGYTSTALYQKNEQNKLVASQEKALEKKIQAATFTIKNPLPTIELNVTKETAKPFHVVAGAFQFPENASKKVKELKKLGYNASIIGVNKWGLTEVVFNSFSDRNDAINNLYKIQKTVSKDAWLLVKK
jgi:hypothetical protein